MIPVEGIEPVDGWVLMWMEYPYDDRLPENWYEAHHPEHGTKLLQVSGRNFHPTQERFAWLIEHGTVQNKIPCSFGYQGVLGVPWNDETIDEEIARAASA